MISNQNLNSETVVEVPPQRTEKFGCLEGIRGFASLMVMVFHFMRGFYPAMNTGMPVEAFGAWVPLTPLYFFYAGTFSVAIFFVLSGFVLSLKYFKTRDNNILYTALGKRYFRLMIPVLVTSLIYYLLLALHIIDPGRLDQLAAITGASFLKSLYHFDPNLLDAVFRSVRVFFQETYQYNSVLWTMSIELAGSMLVYVFLLLFGRYRIRWALYLVLFCLIHNPKYQAFIWGMMLCDAFTAKKLDWLNHKGIQSVCLVAGIYFAAFPHFLDPALLPHTFYAQIPKLFFWMKSSYQPWASMVTGAVLLLAFVLGNKPAQKFFSNTVALFIGKISFAFYLTHYAVLWSFTTFVFLSLYPLIGYHPAALVSFILSLPVMFALAYAVYYWIDRNAMAWSGVIFSKLIQPSVVKIISGIKKIIIPTKSALQPD